VIVEGSGKEQSRSLTDAVTELTQKLRHEPAIAQVKPRFSTDTRGAFTYSISIDTSVVAGTAPATDVASDDEAAAKGGG
jgi:hypothetical protein